MRKSIALFLSFVMLLSVGGAAGADDDAAGADDDAVNVVITDEGNEVSVTIDGEPVEPPPTGETITGVETIDIRRIYADAHACRTHHDLCSQHTGTFCQTE